MKEFILDTEVTPDFLDLTIVMPLSWSV